MFKQKLIILTALLLCANLLSAQGKIEGLIINEVFLDGDNPSNNWVEIYNPTNETLSLTQFAISTFLTPNLLSKEVIESGGIKIQKNDYLLLSADENIRTKLQKDHEKIFVFSELKLVDKGGLINIGTKEKGANGFDIIKYGEDYYSSLGDVYTRLKLIPLGTNGKSFSRNKLNKLDESDFYESEPTPLDKNKEK